MTIHGLSPFSSLGKNEEPAVATQVSPALDSNPQIAQLGQIILAPHRQIESTSETQTSLAVIDISRDKIPPPLPKSSLEQFIHKAVQSVKAALKAVKKFLSDGFRQLIKGQYDLPEFLPVDKKNAVQIKQDKQLKSDPQSKAIAQLQKALEDMNMPAFKEELQRLKQKQPATVVAKIVEELLAEHADEGAQVNFGMDPGLQKVQENIRSVKPPKTTKYDLILKAISEIYPAISDYFIQSTIQGGVNISQISDQGMELILNHLRNKGAFEQVPCQWAPSLAEFSKAASEKIKNSSSEPWKQTFLVRHRNAEDKGSHVSPVYLEKNSNGFYRAIVTDSTGGRNKEYLQNIQDCFVEIFKDIDKTQQNVVFYVGESRQIDRTNCSIFSIRDAVQFSKHNQQILDWTESRTKYESFIDAHVFKSLPSQWMKTDQSMANLQAYEKSQQLSSLIKEKHRLVSDLEPKNRMIKEQKKFNAKIAQTYLKYERLILAHVIKESMLQHDSPNPT